MMKGAKLGSPPPLVAPLFKRVIITEKEKNKA